jgi:hypothetical protein
VASASESAQDAPDRAPGPSRGLVRFSEAIAPEIFAFQREAFPHRRADWIEPRWRWMFEGSAARLGVEPMVWVYRSKGRVVAHQGAIAVKLRTPVGEQVTGWFVETMALEEVRGKAVGSMVVAKALQDLPFNLSLGQTEQMRELQYRLGWKHVAPLNTLVFVLHGGPLAKGRVPGWATPVAGTALTLHQRMRYWLGRRRSASALQVREIARFTPAHDKLWRDVEGHFTVAVVRDASYLNWKYVEQPGQSVVRLELSHDHEVRALAVIRISEPNATYRYRRAWLMDLVVQPDDAGLVWATFEGVRRTCLRLGADLIIFDIISDALVKSALAFGFVRRQPARVLLIAPGTPPTDAGRLALEAANWFVTRGDSDLDRPW